jgi:hypothetical protein
MAVFPDKLILKNTTDSVSQIKQVINPTDGSNPIVPGELVVRHKRGGVDLYSIDANNTVVRVGTDQLIPAVSPNILLNFENTVDDTPYSPAFTTTFPDTTVYKFGTKAATFENELNYPYKDVIEIAASNLENLSVLPWTLQFWIKGNLSDWYNYNDGLGSGFLGIIGSKYYVRGPGAWQVYLDAGTSDQPNAGGTSTSETSGQARGSVVLGIGPGGNQTHDFLPSTGEIVSTRATSVLDGNWHHVVIQHEGEGVYSAFVDGILKQRKFHNEAIDFGDPGDTGFALPQPIRIAGNTSGQDGVTGTIAGLNGTLDAISLHVGAAIYKGLYSYTVPTAAPTDDPITARSTDELRRLYDTDFGDYASLANNSIIQWNSTAQAWQTGVLPSPNLSGSSIGDVSDVELEVYANIGEGETLNWSITDQKFKNQPFTIDNLGNVNITSLANNQFLKYNNTSTNWENHTLEYVDIAGRPTSLSDLSVDINVGDLANVDISSPIDNQVLVYNAATTRWENDFGPAANISANSVYDLSDVHGNSGSTIDDQVLIWNNTNNRFEPGYVDYSDVTGRVVDNIQIANGRNYITNIQSEDLGDLSDVTLSSVSNGDTLVYQNGAWRNLPAAAADISGNVIDDLSDVTNTASGDEKILTIEDVTEFRLDPSSAYMPGGFERCLIADPEFGLGIKNFRSSDDTGTAIYVERGRGVTVRSDMGRLHIQGRLGAQYTNNTPEIRIDSGDSGADTPTGYYVGFTIPSNLTESTDYVLPNEDGDVGDVLATNGNGALTWVAQVSSGSINDLSNVDISSTPPTDGTFLRYNSLAASYLVHTLSLGDASNVDLTTTTPTDGQALVYVAADNEWVAGDVAQDLSTASIDELQDVDTTTTVPTNGQVLKWSGSTWVPGDVVADLSTFSIDDLSDVNTTTIAPSDGQTLLWSAANSEFRPGNAILPGTVTVTKTENSIASNSTSQFDKAVVNGAGLIHSASSDVAGWLRIYESSAARTADAGRLRTVDPEVADGVILEIIFTGNETYTFTPKASYYTNTLYYAFTNDSNTTANVTINLVTVGLA